jgi:hypothetical protein
MKEYNPKPSVLCKVVVLLQIVFLIVMLSSVIKEAFKTSTSSKPTEEVFLQTTATVTSNTLILYADKSAKSSNLKTLKKGEVIVVTGKDDSGWTPAKSGSAIGWVLSSSIAVKR